MTKTLKMTAKTIRTKPFEPAADLLLERRLTEFSADKSKENYVRLLEAFRQTDLLVPSDCGQKELPFANGGVLSPAAFHPAVLYFSSMNKRVMPVFSNQSKIPADKITGKTVFMHCSGWINAFRKTRCDGVILNPFSELSFLLTPDQIRVLSLFQPNASEYR